MVSAVAVVVTVALNQTAVWVAAALLVLLMFSSYALRSWSPRAASLALMGAITVYIIGAGYITIGRIGSVRPRTGRRLRLVGALGNPDPPG